MPRQLVGPCRQRAIAQAVALKHHRFPIRRTQSLRRQEIGGCIFGDLAHIALEATQLCRPVRRHQRQGGKGGPVRCTRHLLQQRHQQVAPLGDTLFIKQIRVIFQDPGNAVGARHHREGQIELGPIQSHPRSNPKCRCSGHIVEGGFTHLLALPGKHRLEHWRVRQRALNIQGLDNTLEWRLLMLQPVLHNIASVRQ